MSGTSCRCWSMTLAPTVVPSHVSKWLRARLETPVGVGACTGGCIRDPSGGCGVQATEEAEDAAPVGELSWLQGYP